MSTVYDLPKDILATLQRKESIESESDLVGGEGLTSDTSKVESSSALEGGSKACSLCGASFHTVEDQRSHTRSDFHNYNLRQKLRGLKPVSEVEFETLVGGEVISVQEPGFG